MSLLFSSASIVEGGAFSILTLVIEANQQPLLALTTGPVLAMLALDDL